MSALDPMPHFSELERCKCLMKEEGMPLVCNEFRDDDHGDCMTCGHREECHERP